MSPQLTLLLTLVLGTVGLTALFWALGAFFQGMLYNQQAEKLPLRALAAGLGVAIFLTGWTYLNTRASHKDKYGVPHEFQPTAQKPVDQFEAVRRLNIKDEKGQPKEVAVPYKWQGSDKGGGQFVEVESNKEFQINTSSYMTVAILVPREGGEKIRFDAEMENGAYTKRADDERRFVEQGGSRHIDARNPRFMDVPSTSAMIGALLINALHYVVWFVAFWVGMRFTVGHSLAMAAVFGTASMLILMPLLFERNELKPVIELPQTAPTKA